MRSLGLKGLACGCDLATHDLTEIKHSLLFVLINVVYTLILVISY